jgi:hypothetical protein
LLSFKFPSICQKRQIAKYPLTRIVNLIHANSLKRIPVSLWRYCLGSIRRTNGDRRNYKRKSAERITLPRQDHYTMKLEQVCL